MLLLFPVLLDYYCTYSKATKKSAPQGKVQPLALARFQDAFGIPRSTMKSSPVTSLDRQPVLGAPRQTVHVGRTQCIGSGALPKQKRVN